MYIPTDSGYWVSEDFCRLAEIIKDYDEHLELRWIPPDKRTDIDTSKPYAIVDTRSDYIVFHASELDTPEEILTRLWSNDNTKHDVMKFMTISDNARKAMELKREIDQREEAMEEAAWLIGTKKNYIKHRGKKLDDQLREID